MGSEMCIRDRKRIAHSRYERTRLFRLTELIGRWSMIDVFVVAILAALVQLGSVAQIEPGLGATAFGATVIFTMLSALALDSRLLWDNVPDNAGRDVPSLPLATEYSQ